MSHAHARPVAALPSEGGQVADYIPFARPTLGDDDVEALRQVVESGWISTGEQASSFEAEIAAYVGCRYAVALNSCTAAIHLALVGLGVSATDEVIVPTMTFTATAAAVVHAGATPVLADISPDTLAVSAATVEPLISRRTKGIVVVHYGGRISRAAQLRRLCDEHGLFLVEDAAHALPAREGQYSVGRIGAAATFSFFATKPITTAEGGMLCTDDAELARRARRLSLHGMSESAVDRYRPGVRLAYDVTEPGFKYNMSDLQAALGRSQLRRATAMCARRAEIAEAYRRELDGLPGFRLPEADSGSSWYLYPIQVDTTVVGKSRDVIRHELERRGIGTSVHFIPLHRFTWYRENVVRANQVFPVADACAERLISLPIYPTMTDGEVARVVKALREVHGDG
jgi:dTDP-4-amino-4,6-dideoxygalactose transaminase